jgi:hypothetical protein
VGHGYNVASLIALDAHPSAQRVPVVKPAHRIARAPHQDDTCSIDAIPIIGADNVAALLGSSAQTSSDDKLLNGTAGDQYIDISPQDIFVRSHVEQCGLNGVRLVEVSGPGVSGIIDNTP